MKRRVVVAIACAVLTAGCAGGGDDPSEAGTASRGGAGTEKHAKLPKANTLDEIAVLLEPFVGPCLKLHTDDAELDARDKRNGVVRKGWCQYQSGNLSFILHDTAIYERHILELEGQVFPVGDGFSVRVLAARDGAEDTFYSQLKQAGLMYLNCNPDFNPYDGVKVVEAETSGCRYSGTAPADNVIRPGGGLVGGSAGRA